MCEDRRRSRRFRRAHVPAAVQTSLSAGLRCRIIHAESGSHFDPAVVKAFEACFVRFQVHARHADRDSIAAAPVPGNDLPFGILPWPSLYPRTVSRPSRRSLARAALPVVGLERRSGQALLVDQVRICHVPPAKAGLGRRGDALGLDDDRVAVDHGLGGNELAVRAGDLELAQRLAVARLQPAADMGEGEPDLARPRPSSTCTAAPSRRGPSCRTPWPAPRGPAGCPRRSCCGGGCRRCCATMSVVTAMPVPGIFRLAAWASQSGGRLPGP